MRAIISGKKLWVTTHTWYAQISNKCTWLLAVFAGIATFFAASLAGNEFLFLA
jgi:hypothetical protein